MFHYRNLYDLFFANLPRNASEFIALSGFVGPGPISDLNNLPFDSKIVFGLFKENQKIRLHQQLVGLHNNKIQIFYPDILCHSKIYLWMNDHGVPIRGFIGSANFSTNGLRNDYRESLLEVDHNQLYFLKGYSDIILNSAIPCIDTDVSERDEERTTERAGDVCEMVLYDPLSGQTQSSHGLNWGLAEGSHVRPDDACIPIRTSHIRNFPHLFPPLQYDPERKRGSLHEVVEIIWDDGVVMQGRLEGSQPVRWY